MSPYMNHGNRCIQTNGINIFSFKEQHRRSRRDTPRRINNKILCNLFVPQCLGEALNRVTLINFYDFLENNEQSGVYEIKNHSIQV